jgi:dihydroorotate dehydrogenase electron transfer subunit
MKKEVRKLIVTQNIALNSTNFLIKLNSSEPLPEFKPGQFVNIEIKDSSEIFLRRPFSIFEVDYK